MMDASLCTTCSNPLSFDSLLRRLVIASEATDVHGVMLKDGRRANFHVGGVKNDSDMRMLANRTSAYCSWLVLAARNGAQ